MNARARERLTQSTAIFAMALEKLMENAMNASEAAS
jgi:hypothetical protein